MVNIGELGVGLKLENWSIEKLTRDIQNQIKQWGDIAGEKLGKGIEKGLDQKQATNELAKDIEQKVGNAWDKAGTKLQQSLWGGLKALVGLGVTKALSSAAWRAYTLAGNLQQADVAFTTMLGGAEAAKKMLQDLSDFAANTPFELTGVRQTAKQLLAYGIEAHKIIPTLKALGDVSAGLSVPIEQVAYAYGQVKSAGRLVGNDLKQFINAGVPIIQELAKNMGVAESQIKDMVSAGKIWFADVEKAFQTMSSEWGKFANLMEKQSDTMMGAWSNLQDSIDSLGEAIGSLFTGEVGGLFKWMASIVEAVKEWAVAHPVLTKALVTFVGVVGGLIGILTALSGVAAVVGVAFWAATLPILAVVGALGAVVAIGVWVNAAMNSTEKTVDTVGKSYKELSDAIKENEQKQKELQERYEKGEVILWGYEESMKDLESEHDALVEAQDTTTVSLQELKDEMEKVKNSKMSAEDKVVELERIRKKAMEAAEALKKAKQRLDELLKQQKKEQKEEAQWLRTEYWAGGVVSQLPMQIGIEKANVKMLEGLYWGTEESFKSLGATAKETADEISGVNKEISGWGGGSSWTSKKVDKLKETMDWLKKSLKDAEDADKKYRDSAEKTAEATRKYYEKLGDEIRQLKNKYNELTKEFEKTQKTDKESFLRTQVEKAKSLEQALLKSKSALQDIRADANKKDSKLDSTDMEILNGTDLEEAKTRLKSIQEELTKSTTEYDRERLKQKESLIEKLKEQLEIENNLKAVNESIEGLGLDQAILEREKKRAQMGEEAKAIYDWQAGQKKKQEEFEKKKKEMEDQLKIYKRFEEQKFLSSAEVAKSLTEENLAQFSVQERELILKLGRERIELEKQKEEKVAMEESLHARINQLSDTTTNLQLKNLGKLKAEYRTLISQIETAIRKRNELWAWKIHARGFSIGGFTWGGANSDIAGVVHKNERVAPAWMTNKFADTFNQLEKIRSRGFAQGGFTSDNSRHIEQNNTITVKNVFDMEEFLDRQRWKLR